MRALDTPDAFKDPNALSQLTAAAADKIKQVELELRKKVDTANQQLFLNGHDEVPSAFQKLVEEYYKSLSKKGGGGR